MIIIDERNLKIVCEPEYGTILYQEQKDEPRIIWRCCVAELRNTKELS